jgi:hypothetical protein
MRIDQIKFGGAVPPAFTVAEFRPQPHASDQNLIVTVAQSSPRRRCETSGQTCEFVYTAAFIEANAFRLTPWAALLPLHRRLQPLFRRTSDFS